MANNPTGLTGVGSTEARTAPPNSPRNGPGNEKPRAAANFPQAASRQDAQGSGTKPTMADSNVAANQKGSSGSGGKGKGKGGFGKGSKGGKSECFHCKGLGLDANHNWKDCERKKGDDAARLGAK